MTVTTTMHALEPLNRIMPSDRLRIGGKAYNCAQLLQAGFPVPDGLAIATDAPDDEIRSLASHAWVTAQPADALFAVRSSGIEEDSEATSFAGMHETLLNVGREALADAVAACRRSARSAQASAYRAARHFDESTDADRRIAVLVQLMVPAVFSGVAFTRNPISGGNELVVNAARGFGEALVSGQVDPDEFIVAKDGRIVSSRVADGASSEPILTSAQVRELADLLVRIERHYDAPQDIEWCHDGRRFWIVQSRPITTIASRSAAPIGAPPLSDIEWTRANLIEVFPDQLSPQVLDFYESMLNRGQRMSMGRLLAPDAELGPMFKSFHGRMYMNLSQMRRVVSLAGAPAADMLRSLGHAEQIHPADEIPTRAPIRELLRCLPDFVRIAVNDARAETLLHRHEARTRETLARITAHDPGSLSDREIWDLVMWWADIAPASIQIVFVMSGVLFRETALRKACNAVGFPYERLVYTQLAAGERSVSTRQATELVRLADVARREPSAARYLLESGSDFTDYRARLAGTGFLTQFDRFLAEYGHRGRFESDWALPRLHENPSPALFSIQQHLQGPPVDLDAVAARQHADAAAAWQEFEARLSWWQKRTRLPRVRALLRRLKRQYVWREQVRFDLTRILRYARAFHLALADRFVERGWIAERDDYFLIRFAEIAPVIANPSLGPGLRAIVTRRRADMAAERELAMPPLMRESELEHLLAAPAVDAAADGRVLNGLCVSPGVVEGEVVVMRDPGDFAAMKRGAILVAPATDPSWTPLFTLASGVIVEVGGMLSHASTIAREYGLPALANVKHATRILQSGERVRLDASGGVVRRIDTTA